MSGFALDKLLCVRELRVKAARAELAQKQRIVAACEAERVRLQGCLESLLMERLRQQRRLNEEFARPSAAHLTALATQQHDQRIGLFTDRATSLGEQIVAADRALEKARLEKTDAAQALRRAINKCEALTTVKSQWRHEQILDRARNEESETEELVLSGYAQASE